MNRLVERAARFAQEKHEGQKRKYTGDPYFVHPSAVADLVASVTKDEHMIAAAYLHDTIEDCGVTFGELTSRFGLRVARLVRELTDISKPEHGNRETRKAIDRAHTAGASSDAKTIKLADLINNTQSILTYDESFAKVYMTEKELLLPHLKAGDEVLYDQARSIVQSYRSK